MFGLVEQIERDDCVCTSEGQEEIQSWMHRLVASYAGSSGTDERIARVIAVERSLGFGDVGDEI